MDWVTWINELYHSGVISKQLKLRKLNIQLFKSFKERMKSRGPSTASCGIPDMTSFFAELLFTTNHYFCTLPDKKHFMQLSSLSHNALIY